MFNKKTRKGSVAASVVSLVLCCVMLLGTTFAWFSTSVSSTVNAIQSGSLKIDLVDAKEDGNSLVGKTIEIDEDSMKGFTTTFWEPGCEATFQDVFVKNESNIDVKYEIKVVGLDGDSKLLDAIEFIDNIEDFYEDDEDYATLAAGETSDAITISAKMIETAGNQYQNLTADGIAVVVYATQVNATEYAKVSAAVKPIDVATIEDVALNTAYTFVPAEADEEKYGTWNADFVVWFDSDVEAGAVTLAGRYDSWNEGAWEVQPVNTEIEADQQIRLLESKTVYINYNEILENVGEFDCGAASTQTGLKMNVELRLYEVKDGAETGEYVVAGSYTYTF